MNQVERLTIVLKALIKDSKECKKAGIDPTIERDFLQEKLDDILIHKYPRPEIPLLNQEERKEFEQMVENYKQKGIIV